MRRFKKIDIARRLDIAPGTLTNILKGTRRAGWNLAKKLGAETRTNAVFWKEGRPQDLQRAVNEHLDRENNNHK